jgi:hypothetical protein
MRPVFLALSALIALPTWAAGPVPLIRLFRGADAVVIGTIESIKRNSDPDILAKTAPKEPIDGVRVSPCEVTIRILAVLKSLDHGLGEGALRRLVWYTPTVTPCAAGSWGFDTDIKKPRLWLLRTENGVLRAVVDDAVPARPLQTFSPEIKRKMEEWKDPALEMIYLFLKPGVRTAEDKYARFADDDGMSVITGFAGYLKVRRAVYLEADDHMRGQISLSAARSGQCLGVARRVALAEDHLDEWTYLQPSFMSEIAEADDEAHLDQMDWHSKAEVLAHFDNDPAKAVDNLIWWACSSMPHAKAWARHLLSKYFGVEPSTLPCIPCE